MLTLSMSSLAVSNSVLKEGMDIVNFPNSDINSSCFCSIGGAKLLADGYDTLSGRRKDGEEYDSVEVVLLQSLFPLLKYSKVP